MASKKIITVFGATGKQGGSIVEKFISDPKLKDEWAVRGVTRDVSKDSAKALASRGVEVVSADMDDKESVFKAVAGSHTVFSVTNYWEKLSKDGETQQGKNIADAAKEAGVQHFIWSTLINVTNVSKGKLTKVYHFDSKAEVDAYVRSLGIPTTFFLAGFYLSNFEAPMWFRQTGPDNAWTFSMPGPITSPVPLYDVRDTGKYVKAIVLNRDALLGGRVLAATEYQTFEEMLVDFRRTFPKDGANARFYELSDEQYLEGVRSAGMPDFVGEELLQNIQLLSQFGYYGGESLDETRKLVEGVGERLTTWAEWLPQSEVFKNLQ
ncbi:hypothetical protein MCOR27_001382 [Pyricularia oryzae]|uniref:NmrA-like domain-containing protein n=5 Tax=Pyricularia TaxID=48558 RepID=A0ABQ8NP88_PYRGI|nr:uncharacterized protein MGG_00156 [Pyricularia oryzae 70-15]ELQ41573.1 hypothetical protein OOU_Y34scaffold00267g10 [Pyricularia oryzae Y34]KAH9433344.1 hypothetical protein MCOR02_005395 [Pyricularia oryzae]KAI6299547.1 hypothetical protein MCOR33_004562 [Pyricularia grisea]EHA49387.1 hypothetical protein MGG_00156 [Pyricularia oryzae 70-15]KAI6259705.1 hypothetical protein MCOR19_003953 [Pyricularia oryzae]